MCMTKYAVSRLMLGNREIGWELWNKEKGEVVEMTAKEIKSALLNGDPIYGLAVGEDGDLVLDKDFFMRNLMEHRHVNNYTPMIEDENCVANVAYIVIGKSGNEYDVISSKWQRTTISEERLRVYISMGIIFGGAALENDRVVLPDLEKKEGKKPAEQKTEPKANTKKEAKKQ